MGVICGRMAPTTSLEDDLIEAKRIGRAASKGAKGKGSMGRTPDHVQADHGPGGQVGASSSQRSLARASSKRGVLPASVQKYDEKQERKREASQRRLLDAERREAGGAALVKRGSSKLLAAAGLQLATGKQHNMRVEPEARQGKLCDVCIRFPGDCKCDLKSPSPQERSFLSSGESEDEDRYNFPNGPQRTPSKKQLRRANSVKVPTTQRTDENFYDPKSGEVRKGGSARWGGGRPQQTGVSAAIYRRPLPVAPDDDDDWP